MNEAALGLMLCGLLGGSAAEVSVSFDNLQRQRRIRIDCLTDDYAFEFGLDKASSRDSVHQAVFAAELTNTTPFVVLIDTDGEEGRYEQEMRLVTQALDIPYATCGDDFIVRRSSTSAFRGIGLDKEINDLPSLASYSVGCDLVRALSGQ